MRMKRNARVRKFEEQFPEALALMSRALKAGHTFTTGLQMVAEEMPTPIGPEFKLLFDEQNYGRAASGCAERIRTASPAAGRTVLRDRGSDSARGRRQPGRDSRQHRDRHSRSVSRQAADSGGLGARADDRVGADRRATQPRRRAVHDQPGSLEHSYRDRSWASN